jgi:hypothetical protein
MQNITILEGTYKIRGNEVDLAGMTFPMVEDFKVGARGGYVQQCAAFQHVTSK